MTPSVRLSRLLTWTGIMGLLLAVLGLYLQPEFMVHMAEQLWACF